MANWHDGEAQRQGDAANNIASNGGMGSIEYWDAVMRQRNAQTNSDLHEQSMKPPAALPDYSIPPLAQPYKPGAYGGYAPARSKPLGRNFWLALAVAGLSVWAGWQWDKAHVVDPDYVMDESIFLSPDVSLGYLERSFSPAALKKEQQWAAKRFGEKYGEAFKPGTDFMELFSCSNAPGCLNVFPQNLERLRKHAVSPADMVDAVCSIHFRNANAWLLPVEPKFVLAPYKYGRQEWSCKMENHAQVKSALAKANVLRREQSFGVGALAFVVFGALGWRLRKRPEKKGGPKG